MGDLDGDIRAVKQPNHEDRDLIRRRPRHRVQHRMTLRPHALTATVRVRRGSWLRVHMFAPYPSIHTHTIKCSQYLYYHQKQNTGTRVSRAHPRLRTSTHPPCLRECIPSCHASVASSLGREVCFAWPRSLCIVCMQIRQVVAVYGVHVDKTSSGCV